MATSKGTVRAVINRWRERWEQLYGKSTHKATAKELGRALEIVRARGSKEAQRMVDAYFDRGSDYVRRARHPLALFLAQADAYAGGNDGTGTGEPKIATVDDFDVEAELCKPGREVIS